MVGISQIFTSRKKTSMIIMITTLQLEEKENTISLSLPKVVLLTHMFVASYFSYLATHNQFLSNRGNTTNHGSLTPRILKTPRNPILQM